MASNPSLPIEQYHVGIICALRHEMAAAIATLDERHQPIAFQDVLDPNNYVLGRVHRHNVVIACLPAGIYGTNAAARVANDMLRTFQGLRIGLMVGIGGGIPDLEKGIDIRLGDVVISQPDKTSGGVIQYDLGSNQGEGQFERKGFLKPPPTLLLSALSTLQAEHELNDSAVPQILEDMVAKYPKLLKTGYRYPGDEHDTLYCSLCDGSIPSSQCDACNDGKIDRLIREDKSPFFWYGIIASGNQVIKDAAERNKIGHEFGVICVEMEAAGLMNDFPCIVIRGVCDYADRCKNDGWQKYAALVAAAYAKELLGYISPQQTSMEKPIQDMLVEQSSLIAEHLLEVKIENQKQDQRYLGGKSDRCLQVFKTSTYELFKDLNPDRANGTCQWVLCHPQFISWSSSSCNDLLWISADPGCGKSVLTKSLVDNELRSTDSHTVCYFFFKDNDEQDALATALCALLHQLFVQQSQLIRHAMPGWEKNGDHITKEVSELWRILLAAGMDPEARDVTCIFDALDECQPTDRQTLIAMISNFYTQISAATGSKRSIGRLKILVTSRPYDDIEIDFLRGLENLPTIRLRGEEKNDQISNEIDRVIRMRVDRLARDLLLNDQTKGLLETKLLEMEHRTYLWLHLATQSIYETYRNSLKPEHAAISLLPSSVEDAYEKILNRVSIGQRDIVKKILLIVVGARRPLTIEEMAIALGIAISPDSESLSQVQLDSVRLKDRIRDWCGLFVFINHERIYLIHQTAKEFLLRGGESVAPLFGWKQCLHSNEVEKEMARICVQYLLREEVVSLMPSILHKLTEIQDQSDIKLVWDGAFQQFLAYTTEYWPAHLRDAELSAEEHGLMANVQALYDSRNSINHPWFGIFRHICQGRGIPPKLNLVHLAAFLGHVQILRTTLKSKQCPNLNEVDNTGRTALTWSSEEGYADIVRLLLEHGAIINSHGVGEVAFEHNPLFIAIEIGHEKVVETLLDWAVGTSTGANTNGEIFTAKQLSYALVGASRYGHPNIVKVLLEHETEVNLEEEAYGNAVIHASVRNNVEVVKILLDHGADVNFQEGYWGNAAIAASFINNAAVLEILLEYGADVNFIAGAYGTAMIAASVKGNLEILEMLIENGADVNVKAGDYGTAVIAASINGHSEILKILVEHGADVKCTRVFYSFSTSRSVTVEECGNRDDSARAWGRCQR
ncbi:hypothetical protein LTR84_001898 [Exophiala bonariae]|uniref:NACHT domain-containing protein n=1 Tax=Exophiala bonariae TaxID=1690606 RepID=A0AAV9NFF6_9EURO|nr:hypothetical protein LTR84_001898 [Exophiala bonariae]